MTNGGGISISKTVQCQFIFFFNQQVMTPPRLSDHVTAYCTEMGVRLDPRSFGRISWWFGGDPLHIVASS